MWKGAAMLNQEVLRMFGETGNEKKHAENACQPRAGVLFCAFNE